MRLSKRLLCQSRLTAPPLRKARPSTDAAAYSASAADIVARWKEATA